MGIIETNKDANTQSLSLAGLLESGALSKNTAQFARPRDRNLLERANSFEQWWQARSSAHTWPFSRSIEEAPRPEMGVRWEDGKLTRGINLASQDYLSLTSHPSIPEVAKAAIDEFGPHSAGSPMLVGNTRLSAELEGMLAETFKMDCVMLFPTGWGAGFGAIVGLVRQYDTIVMDELAHACLQVGSIAATANIIRCRHRDTEHLSSILQQLRDDKKTQGILVITEGLFSMDSDMPNLRDTQNICRQFEAALLVDVAHDFGALGPEGTGRIGMESMLGEIDMVMGSFSKTFATNGGFIALKSNALKQYMKWFAGPHIFSNAISPVQCAVALQALKIVQSPEGERRRQSLLRAVDALRSEFKSAGLTCMGEPSAIVPLLIGREQLARIIVAILYSRELLLNIIEFPAVALGAARFRMQVMADHTPEQMKRAAEIVSVAVREGTELLGT